MEYNEWLYDLQSNIHEILWLLLQLFLSTDVVTVTFEADENLPQPVNDATAPIPVVDDEINEIFIVVLTVESATIKF